MVQRSEGPGSDGNRTQFVERRSGARRRVPALTVLWHPHVERVGERVRLGGLLEGGKAVVSRTAPGFQAPGGTRAHPLDHESLEGLRVRLAPGSSGFGAVRLEAPREGQDGLQVEGEPVAEDLELSPAALEAGVVLELRGAAVLLLHRLPAEERWEPMDFGLVGESEGVAELRREIRRVADLEVPVLLRGETGTGKELMARAIHRSSRRRDQPYHSVNLGAIPGSLAASELFGASKGAFTGAVRAQVGYFARAHRGTIFLDEVGEAPPEVQVMLLRVLESGEIQPLGVQETQEVDVRLIAATDVDLETASEDGDFRAPLLHRLAGYEIVVPPVRERRDDFGRLLIHFLRQELEGLGESSRLEGDRVLRWLPTSIVTRLARHEWPGNVRQIKNVARQIAIGSRGAETVRITPQLERILQEAVAHGARAKPPAGEPPPASDGSGAAPKPRPEYRDPADVREAELLEALRRNRWLVKPTARELGISRTSLYALIDRNPAVRKASDLDREEILRVREECGGDLDTMGARLEVSTSGLRQRMKELAIEV
ncbi:MAG: sigma 54-interacting transcriptional regulator [Thermoanaerobaculia bacterium]